MASCRKCGTDEIDLICEDCRWIDVKDGLPEEGYYLGWVTNPSISQLDMGVVQVYYSEDTKSWETMKYRNVTVTHWMPLPSPPSEREVS